MLTKARISNICVSLGPIATVPTLSSEKEEEYKKEPRQSLELTLAANARAIKEYTISFNSND